MSRIIIVLVLIICLYLFGCSYKLAGNGTAGDYKNEGSGVAESIGSSDAKPGATEGEASEIQNDTKQQDDPRREDVINIVDPVVGTESSDLPINESFETMPEDEVENTETPALPTVTTSPDDKESDTPGYGIQLPEDSWG